ncbi:hypothetical protein HIM_11916 [Hirsutella minnesotensis 3608]|uniref:Rhodopsin domain-containing protein n=1 Tax=Hirsutella minnesotensis 3608 TaxID=1043627 RepID=A0A0F8A0N6_9HYPO|nr:hypothetical protein HIM_11916 [Hirsutella minnesotensis 3608]
MGAREALIETWCLYAFGSVIIFARVACRWRMVGISGFKPDDYIIFLSWMTYTVMTVAAHIVGGLGDLHALDIEQRAALSVEEAKPYIYGTQWFCAGVATYILFIWTLKLNMLFLYQRVVSRLWVAKFIKSVMGVVFATFFAIYLILFCACRPYYRMWIVYPDQGPICEPQSTLNMVPPLIMNILTDVMIMAIPAPILLNVKTTFWKKLGLLALFGGGLFIMVAAILRVTMVMIMKNGPTAAIWSCREDFVAILVGQAILIRPLFFKSFWTQNPSIVGRSFHFTSENSSKPTAAFEMNSRRKLKRYDPFSLTAALATVDDYDNSQEDIIGHCEEQRNAGDTIIEQPGDVKSGTAMTTKNEKLVIHVSKLFEVENTEEKSNVPHHTHQMRAGSQTKAWTDARHNDK